MIRPNRLILHHTGDISKSPQLKKVDEYHKQKFGMYSSLGYWVGYHVFIERDGSTTLTRKYYEEGAHTKGSNKEAIGVCFAGNFDFEAPTKQQLDALETVRRDFALYSQIPDIKPEYHFNLSDTHCPGLYFQNNDWKRFILVQRINWLKQILKWIKNIYHF